MNASRIILGLALTVGIVAVWWVAFRPSTADPPTPSPTSDVEPESGPAWFREYPADCGVNFTCRNGEEANLYTILESLGGGVGLLDYDGDGRLDLFLIGGGRFDGPKSNPVRGQPCGLFRNLGNGRFAEVTVEAGLSGPWWYTHGVAVSDYDRDGWPDLLVTGFGRQALFHNEPKPGGGRVFADVTTRSGLEDSGWTTGAGFADLDGDGFPDLYVCRYTDWSLSNNPPCSGQVAEVSQDICPPHRFRPLEHALYRNERGERFRNISGEHHFKPESYGLGVCILDLNDDARPDIYVTNDMTRNMLYYNRGGGKLEESGIGAGTALDDSGRATASMGIDAADYDGTGRPSLFVTNFERELPSLFRNLGRERFYYQSQAAGLARIGRSFVGWGAAFLDADNDGWPDVAIANGHLFRHPAGVPVRQRPLLLLNKASEGRRVFTDAGTRGGAFFQTPAVARGLAVGDLDNDGWPDLVLSRTNGSVAILKNEAVSQLPHHWMGFRLRGKSHRDVTGTTIRVTVGDRTVVGFTKGGGSYLSASDSRILIGLGTSEKAERVTVKWSWGGEEVWTGLQSDRYHDLNEGQAGNPP